MMGSTSSVPAQKLVQRTMSCLSEEELQTLCNLKEKVRERAFQFLNPREDINRLMAEARED